MRGLKAFLIGLALGLAGVTVLAQQGTWVFQNNGQSLTTATPSGTYAVTINQTGAGKALNILGSATVDNITVTGTCSGCTGSGAGITGSPAAGNLTKFSGTGTITNGDLSGDISTSGTLVTAIGAGKVTNAMLAGSIALSKLSATLSGNTTVLGTTTGVLTSGDCVKLDASGNFVDSGAACGSGGAGTVTHTAGALTLNQPVFGNGGADTKIGSISGNTTIVVSTTGALTSGNCVKIDPFGNFIDNGSTCGGGGGAPGTTNDVPFNNGTGFGADTGAFTYVSGTHILSTPLLSANGYFEARAAKTANYTLTSSDSLVTGDSSGGTFTLTLPTAVGISGRQYTLKKIDSSTTVLTVGTTSSQTIDGAATQALVAQGCVLTVESNGSNWDVKSGTCPGFADPGADKLLYFNNTTKLIAAATAIPTNTTIVVPYEYVLPTGIVQAGTATATCSLPSSGAPTATAAASSTALVGDLAFSGSATNTWECHFPLPHDWASASTFDVRYVWRAASTTGNVVWTSKWGVVAAGATLAGMTYGNTTSVTSAAQGTTLQLQTAASTGISVTGAAADGELFVQVSRAGGTGSDTMSGSAELIAVRVILRRTLVVGS